MKNFISQEQQILEKAFDFFSDSTMDVQLLQITPDVGAYVGGLICYGAKTLRDKKRLDKLSREKVDRYLLNRISDGHLSLLRHTLATVLVRCSRVTSHQLVRHVFVLPHQRSQRYCNEGEFDYIIPPLVQEHKDLIEEFKELVGKIRSFYGKMVDKGIPVQDARYILPNAVKTELILSGNFQAWYDFFKLRLDKHAQWEIRALAYKIRDLFIKETVIFKKYEEYCDYEGIETLYDKANQEKEEEK